MVILFDRFNMSEDIFELVFATEQQALVAKLLIDYMKQNKGTVGKTAMGLFASKLDEGELITTIQHPKYRGKKVKLSYNKKQFYDRILTPCMSMGFIDYDMYKKVYKLSDNFHKELLHIGLLWKQELDKPNKLM
tara:strand:+ start:431 stop:832 length:402 start_codon:yes stop_codon:yes gene_type:complete